MSATGLRLFRSLCKAVLDEDHFGDEPPLSASIEDCSEGEIRVGNLQFIWLLDGHSLERKQQFRSHRKQSSKRNPQMKLLRNSWAIRYGSHLSLGVRGDPLDLLRRFEVIDQADSDSLSKIGLKPSDNNWPTLDEDEQARGRFSTWQNEWIRKFYKYDPTAYGLLENSRSHCYRFSKEFQGRLWRIPESAPWLSRVDCVAVLHGEENDENEKLISWIYASRSDQEYWWRLAMAGCTADPQLDEGLGEDDDEADENTSLITVDVNPLVVEPSTDPVADSRTGIPFNAGYEFGYASGERDAYKRVYRDVVGGRLISGVSAQTAIEFSESNGRLDRINSVARLLNLGPFDAVEEGKAAIKKWRLKRQPVDTVKQAASEVMVLNEDEYTTKDDLIDKIIAAL